MHDYSIYLIILITLPFIQAKVTQDDNGIKFKRRIGDFKFVNYISQIHKTIIFKIFTFGCHPNCHNHTNPTEVNTNCTWMYLNMANKPIPTTRSTYKQKKKNSNVLFGKVCKKFC